MKILEAKIRWMDGYLNSPDLQVLVDKIPDHKDLIYKMHKVDAYRTLYFAELNGYVDFYCHDKKNEEGYGGREFVLKCYNDLGELGTITIKGPWSSNSMSMSKYFIPCIEVCITDEQDTFKRGFTFSAGAITIEKAKEAVNKIQGASLLKVKLKWLKGSSNEYMYVVSKVGSQPESIEVIHSR